LAIDPAARPTADELACALHPPRRTRWRLPLIAGGMAALVPLTVIGYERFSRPTPSRLIEAPAPSFPSDPFGRGMYLYKKRELTLAADEFLAAARAGFDGRANACAAYCLAAKKNHAEAIDIVSAIEPRFCNAPVFANRAYSQLDKANFAPALEDCDRALAIEPGLPAAHYTRAIVYLRLFLRHSITDLGTAVTDIDFVVRHIEPKTAEMWASAATIYALASTAKPALKDAAIDAVRSAIGAGKSPDELRQNPKLMAALAGHKDLAAVLVLQPGQPVTGDNPHLVFPFPDPIQ
jgi:tetratricopeptide (TPR) repeat protein